MIRSLLVAALLLLAMRSGEAETPPELLVSARHHVTAAAFSDLPAERLRHLRSADTAIGRLLAGYPDSEPSNRLRAGEAVAGMRTAEIAEDIEKLEAELGPCLSEPSGPCLFDLAVAAAREIQDQAYRGPALASVASTLARAGDKASSEALLKEAITAVSDNAEKSVIDEVRSLAAWVMADLGNFDEAMAHVEQTQSALARALAFNDIVKAHLSRGDPAAAREVLQLAEDNLAETTDESRASVQAVLSESYARAGDSDNAIIHGYEAAESAKEIAVRDVRDTATVFAVRALAYAGESAWANHLTNNQISDASFRCVAFAFLSEYRAEIEKVRDVLALIELAEENCPEPEDIDQITAYAALSIARAFALTGEFDHALEVLRRLPDASLAQAWGFGEVGVILQR